MKKEINRCTCLVVDDEPLAADLLKSYIENIEELQLAGICYNALDALALLRKKKIDLIFLDIQMPKLTGLEFIKTLEKPPAIIITTAYREYAVEGFELNVADYLVKPVSFERFLKAVEKVLIKNTKAATHLNNITLQDEPYVYYKVERQLIKVFLKEILWIESQKDYIKVVLKDNRILITYQRISYAEENLPAALFTRIHRSFIVAKDKITGFGTGEVFIGKQKLPVGNSYKQIVQRELI